MIFDIEKFISSPGSISIIFFVVAFWNFKKGSLLKKGKLNKKDNPVVFYGMNFFLLLIGIALLILGVFFAIS